MYWYLSFLRPPPIALPISAEGVVITPQVANDLRTELRDEPTPIQYVWQRVQPASPSPSRAVDLTVFEPPASTYRPITVPLPRSARVGEKWRLGLVSPPATNPGTTTLLSLSDAEPGVLGVWSEGIEIRASEVSAASSGVVRGVGADKKGKDSAKEKNKKAKEKRDDTPKQTRINRAWLLPNHGQLKVVEQTSFDLDKKVWDSGLALSSWLWRYVDETHPDPLAASVLAKLRPDARVLELGSGTGLVSIALAQIGQRREPDAKARIVATDLESALEIMEENIALNGVHVSADVLDWDAPLPDWVSADWPDVVIAADVTYNTASFPSLVRTLDALLRPSPAGGEAPPLLLVYKQRDVAERELWSMLAEKGIDAKQVGVVRGSEEVGESEVWIMQRR